MTNMPQIDLLVGALAIGMIYSLVALGFSLIIRATNILHFAQGEVLMLGGMAGLTLLWWVPLPFPQVLLVGMAAGSLLATLLELGVYRHLRRRNIPLSGIVAATIGISIVLTNGARLIWGSEPMQYPLLFSSQAFEIYGVTVAPQALVISGFSIVIMLALHMLLNHSRVGAAMQAAAQDAEAARLMGINVNRMTAYTFAIGGALAGAAGVMLGSMFFAYFEMGFMIGIKGFVAATLGGLGSIPGAIVGGLLLGFIETYSAVLISSAYKDAIGMFILIFVLIFMPSGMASAFSKLGSALSLITRRRIVGATVATK